MKAARIGARTVDIERAAEAVVKVGLLKLNLITDASGLQFRTRYTHGICHWIGMDVHDVGNYRRPLEAGMAFVIEPGIYIRPEVLEQLPDTPENRAFREKVRPAVDCYAGVGYSGLVPPHRYGADSAIGEGAAHARGNRRLHAWPSVSSSYGDQSTAWSAPTRPHSRRGRMLDTSARACDVGAGLQAD